ncbi:MAG: hypothetical protein DYG88_13445 [Chloroflexi bacterium CFX4]|nr:hypothetical protein [Chloroflexi bacterium CFX4]MDL1923535.1 hypothetical protein [Chloroflexi bacterium CFX3]
MSLGGYLLLIFFSAFALLIILLPLLSRRTKTKSEFTVEFGKMPLVQQLAQEREAVLQALRDLEFDYQTGKITHEDYLPQRKALMKHAAELLQHLEAEHEATLEAAIRAARQPKTES